MSESQARYRVGVDIGGTFTDVALAGGGRTFTSKVLTTPKAPEAGVMQGMEQALGLAAIDPADVEVVIHGTTLATNAIIERKGARTALVVTEGFRDSVEMAYENRFEQYDINVQKPAPLVPRYLRVPVRERMDALGRVLLPPDPASIEAMIERLAHEEVESIAVGFVHGYANPAHEELVAERLRETFPDTWLTLSSDVCAEIREYERLSTACANAYVQPLMARYLQNLRRRIENAGIHAPLLMMTSGGGLATVETAIRHPIRLVESGPAGGAILASRLAAEKGIDQVLSFDMGGTTAKICLIDGGQPQSSRTFEVDRVYRFTKGSGLPLRIPVIEMVEIGAGGGSIAHLDRLGRIAVGPESAGAEPGPACYGRGGDRATVTDADVVLGRIDPERFAGGSMPLRRPVAARALAQDIGEKMNLGDSLAAFAVSEVVDENMANAARVHAIERGKDAGSRTLIAFGGAAPLHATRLAAKLGIDTVIVPGDAGVGSAIGFLHAPVSYEVVRSRYTRLSTFDAKAINEMFEAMRREAEDIVRLGAPSGVLVETRIGYMRYVGQGHEVEVSIPCRRIESGDAETLQAAFDASYRTHYARVIPGMDVEVLTWSLTLTSPVPAPEAAPEPPACEAKGSVGHASLFNTTRADYDRVPVYPRDILIPGTRLRGPALIPESQTTTVVGEGFDARIDGRGNIVMEKT